MNNILVTIEFEEHSQQLIDYAVKLADKFNSKIWLLHVAAPNPDFVGYEVGPQYIRDMRAEELKSEHKKLDVYSKDLRGKGFDTEALLIQGATAETILSEAQKLQADLIIIGHHFHSWFYKVFGQTTDVEVIDKTNIPVLIIPIPEED
ncbi:universal stress protein [bacterium]|nr:universal stress protein [bacterium]